MNDTHDQNRAKVATLAQSRLEASDDARAFIDNGPRIQASLRQRLNNEDKRYMDAQVALRHRFEDERQRLEQEHVRERDRLSAMLLCIEAMLEHRR